MNSRGNTHAAARWAAVLLAGGVLVVAAACSGNDKPAGPVRPEDASCQPLNEFESFRYIFRYKFDSPQPAAPVDETQVGDPLFAIAPNAPPVTLEQTFNGAYRRPDSYMVSVDTNLGGASQTESPPIELLFVGGVGWVNFGEWQQTESPNAYPPITVCEAVLPGLDLSGLAGSQEKIDGEIVTHFRREDAQTEAVGTLFGPESDHGRLLKTVTVDVWLAEEGWPMRLEARAAGLYPSGREVRVEFSLELKDINADDIKIQPPQ